MKILISCLISHGHGNEVTLWEDPETMHTHIAESYTMHIERYDGEAPDDLIEQITAGNIPSDGTWACTLTQHAIAEREDKVAAFHDKYDLSQPDRWVPNSHCHNGDVQRIVAELAEHIEHSAQRLESYISDSPEALRYHLLAEEFAELLSAPDEVSAFDAVCDLQYVLSGTAVTFNWPLAKGFDEVHRSNMTKARKSDDPGRLRDKGDSYEPPQLKELLDDQA